MLLDLPVVLTWLVGGVKQLLHPDTRGKVRVVRSADGAVGGQVADARHAPPALLAVSAAEE